jgi:CBS domain-containing protein
MLVRDIMQRDLVTVSADMTARNLARLLADEEITGVPVVDANDRLVGVVSSSDLVRLAADESGVDVRSHALGVAMDPTVDSDPDAEEPEEPDPYGFFLPEDSPFGRRGALEWWPDSEFDSVVVRDIMTPITFSVEPDMPVPELCAFLVRGRIHRAVVVEDGRLLGIVTSADVLRAVAEERLAVAR